MAQTRKRSSKASFNKTRKSSKKSALNKVEEKQVDSKIKSAIRKNNTLKYFNANSSDNGVAPKTSTVSNKNEVSVIGFSSTTEFSSTSPSAALKYGQQDIYPLYLSRPFPSTGGTTAANQQSMDGQNCLPKMAKSIFSIERVAYAVEDDDEGLLKQKASRSLPISYRIIKVAFKNVAGTTQTINPNIDLFRSVIGQEKGIDSDDFDRLDCKYAKINTDKYTKLMDIQGTISQNNIITPVIHPRTSGNATNAFAQKNGKSHMDLTVNFQLSSRKNGKMFYIDPNVVGSNAMKSPTSGGTRQMLFIHTWYDNGHNLLGGTGQGTAPDENDLQIKNRSMSAFIDTA
jgi:hypothetical protein